MSRKCREFLDKSAFAAEQTTIKLPCNNKHLFSCSQVFKLAETACFRPNVCGKARRVRLKEQQLTWGHFLLMAEDKNSWSNDGMHMIPLPAQAHMLYVTTSAYEPLARANHTAKPTTSGKGKNTYLYHKSWRGGNEYLLNDHLLFHSLLRRALKNAAVFTPMGAEHSCLLINHVGCVVNERLVLILLLYL